MVQVMQFLVTGLTLLCALSINADVGIYSIVGSNSIKEGETFKFSVISQNYPESLQANFSLSGTDLSGNEVSLSDYNNILSSDEILNFVFDTKLLSKGQYTFYAHVYDPMNQHFIFDRYPLQFLPRLYHIIIQTDKELYKAEDLLRFRLFAFDTDTFPVDVTGPKSLTIVDPLGFTIRNVTDFDFVKGRYYDEMQLSAFITYGVWVIRIQVDEQIFEKTVNVEMYELPMFYANIVVPQHVALTDGTFPVKVEIDYAFGKSMQGVAVVKFLRFSHMVMFEKRIIIGSESGTFNVNIASNLGVTSEELVDIQLDFTDSMSNKMINASAYTIIKNISTVLGIEASETFKRDQLLEFAITAIRYDGEPAPEHTEITIEFLLEECEVTEDEFDRDCSDTKLTRSYETNEMGIVHGEIPTEKYDYISFQASCRFCGAAVHFAELHEPRFEIRILTEHALVNNPVDVEVETIYDFSTAFCYFLAQNVHRNLISITFTNGLSHFTFIPNGQYTPMAQITCVGIDQYGQRYETQKIIDLEQLPGKFNIELLTENIEPGMQASLRVTGSMHSVVSLLATDERLVALQKSRGFGNTWKNLKSQMIEFTRNQSMSSSNFEMLRRINIPETTTDVIQTAPTVIPRSSKVVRNRRRLNPFVMPTEDLKPLVDESGFRRNFQETFLWLDVEIENSLDDDETQGEEIIEFTVPDSITSFMISGIGFSDDLGAGMSESSPSLMSFRPFFLQLDLPFSIKQSETLLQMITVFNYMDEAQNSLITISQDVKFTIDDPGLQWMVLSDTYAQSFVAMSNSIRTFVVSIRPLSSGTIPIKVAVGGALADDRIMKDLKVLPDGIERIVTNTVLIMKEGSSSAEAGLSCAVPSTVAPNTVSTSINFVGDLMGGALYNLNKLIVQPSGCGEQNLARFAPALVVHLYLTASGQMTPDTHNTIVNYAEEGLQKHLTLRIGTGAYVGSYRFFSVNEGCTWLTAFSVKIFRQAQTFMTIDESLKSTALSFIMTKQEGDGGFREDETSGHYRYQGGLIGKVSVSSYIAILLTEILATGQYPEYETARDNAINFVAANVNNANAYELAITCYALFLVDHPSFDVKYQQLLTLSVEHSELMYWQVNNGVALDVEVTSYALLFISKIDISRAIKITRYITSQRNENSGWPSTQDTVMAVESLAAVAPLLTNYNGTLDLMAWPDVGNLLSVTINDENKMSLQTFNLDSNTRSVNIFARGPVTSKAIVSLTCRYFENFDDIAPRFFVTYDLVERCNTPLQIKVCINYIPDGDDIRSNMVIMRMQMPSGYIYDSDTPLPEVVRKLDTENANTKIIAYFDSMTTDVICFTIHAFQTYIVGDYAGFLKGLIEVNDYYSPEKKAELFYEIPDGLSRC